MVIVTLGDDTQRPSHGKPKAQLSVCRYAILGAIGRIKLPAMRRKEVNVHELDASHYLIHSHHPTMASSGRPLRSAGRPRA
ncbi:MAG: hypothetical protein NTX50_12560, partial [Candidatus Sumerlaeota bacterium]|nr:hypothetical protein [Candidatus Sumerlaeota bacterium]